MNIQNATINDIKTIIQIKPEIEIDTINKRLERQSQGEIEFLILENNGQPVGFVLLKYLGKNTHPEYPDIEDLYIQDNQRGQGYGSILIKECEQKAIQKGFSKIGMAVNPKENCPAYRLYEHLGYKPTNEKPYVDGVYNGIEDWCIDLEKILK